VSDSVTASAAITAKTTPPVQRPSAPTEARDTKPSIVDPAKSPANATEKAPAKPEVSAPPSSGYSVQVAAYGRKSDADKLVSILTKRGYQARVDGSVAPFRVRIGRYATNREAEAALVKIRPNYKDAFVARAPER
jgi:cell division protein FtsN